jgi:hypothetical protein
VNKKPDFLAAFEACHGRKGQACRIVGICAKIINVWLDEDPDFAAQYEEIRLLYVETVEDRLDERSKNEKGMAGVVATVAILNAEAPEKYKRPGVISGISGDLRIHVTLEPQPLPQWEEPKQLKSGA